MEHVLPLTRLVIHIVLCCALLCWVLHAKLPREGDLGGVRSFIRFHERRVVFIITSWTSSDSLHGKLLLRRFCVELLRSMTVLVATFLHLKKNIAIYTHNSAASWKKAYLTVITVYIKLALQ